MTDKRSWYGSGVVLYTVIEAGILLSVKLGEIFHLQWQLIDFLQYTAILINTIVVFMCYVKYGRDPANASVRPVAYGLFLTAAADVFLSLIGTEQVYVPGVLLFCIVQMLYAFWLAGGISSGLKKCVKPLLLYAVLYAAVLFAAQKAGMLNLAAALGILDALLLAGNTVLAWTSARDRAGTLFRAGIALFLCCDISIGIKMLAAGTMQAAAAFLIWVFYIPSQVCITLSYVRKTGMNRSIRKQS